MGRSVRRRVQDDVSESGKLSEFNQGDDQTTTSESEAAYVSSQLAAADRRNRWLGSHRRPQSDT